MPLPIFAAIVVRVAVGAAAKVIAKRAATAAAKKAAKKALPKPTPKPTAPKPAPKGGGKGPGNTVGRHKAKKTGRRKPSRRCELVPYDELECEAGQEAHHVVPDWMLRLAKRGGPERIPDLPSLAKGPAICMEGGSGKEHNTAHKHTDKVAQRIAKASGTPGTLPLGQAKRISARAIEKATGGPGKGGCSRKEIQDQLDQMVRAPDSTAVRGVKDARKVNEAIREAVNPTGPRGK